MSLLEKALPTVETLINKTLHLDAISLARLTQLQGQSVKFELLNVNQHIYIDIHAQGIHLHTETNQTPDIIIRGTPLDLFKLRGKKRLNLYQSGVKIIGDMGLAEELITIINQLDINWEAVIARYTSQQFAEKMGEYSRKNRDWLVQSRQHLKQDIKHFLQEEIQVLPPRLLADEFRTHLNQLHTDVERLMQRVQQLH